MKTNQMRKGLMLLVAGLFISVAGFAQQSPKAEAKGKIGGANVTIKYSSPFVKGRKIWGELVPYGKVWRAGADNATTFETDKAITVEGKTLAAGKYGFFVIPAEGEWTVIFNSVPDQWGAFKYDQSKDVLRVNVKPKKAASSAESLAYHVSDKGFDLAWENVVVPVSVK
ncbi:DUF2911 domain-containing protein [Emticicia sp. CRIBPO]|nr:DUF2911 domain-containing protein [Emticicia sp. CRIBPO]